MYEMQVQDRQGNWHSLKPSVPEGNRPYRYERQQDAQDMLDKLFPELPACRKRVVPAVGLDDEVGLSSK
jgi:hypothetical protein